MIDAKNKQNIPLIDPSQLPINPDNRISPNPMTSLFFFIIASNSEGIARQRINTIDPNTMSIRFWSQIKIFGIINIYKMTIE